MNTGNTEHEEMPSEIDFRKGRRGLHHIPASSQVFMPASIERSVWEYFRTKADQRGIELSDLLPEVLRQDIELRKTLE